MRLPARIGAIEIGANEVRVVAIRTGVGKPHVLDLAHAPIPSTETDNRHAAAVSAVRGAMSQLQVRPDTFVLVVPATWSVLRLLKVPFRAPRKIAAAVPFELEPNLAIPIEDLIVDYVPSRQVDRETEVLAMGVRRRRLEDQLAVLRDADVPVQGAYLDALALTSLWYTLSGAGGDGAQAVLHLRPHEAYLGVVENKHLTFMRRVEIDATRLRTDPAGIAREVRNQLRAYAADREGLADITSLTVTGAELLEAGRMVFEAELETAVHYAELAVELPGFAAQAPEPGMDPDARNVWSAPIAAAANAGGGPFHVNFFPPEFAGGATQRSLAKVGLATCLAGAAVILVFLALVYVDFRKSQDQLETLGAAIWKEFEATYPDIAVERPPGDVGGAQSFTLMQEAAYAESESEFGISLELFNSPPLLDVLLEISAHLPEKVAAVRNISLRETRSGQEITLSGEIRNSMQYNNAVQQLDASPLLDVDRDRSTRSVEGGIETFTLRAKI